MYWPPTGGQNYLKNIFRFCPKDKDRIIRHAHETLAILAEYQGPWSSCVCHTVHVKHCAHTHTWHSPTYICMMHFHEFKIHTVEIKKKVMGKEMALSYLYSRCSICFKHLCCCCVMLGSIYSPYCGNFYVCVQCMLVQGGPACLLAMCAPFDCIQVKTKLIQERNFVRIKNYWQYSTASRFQVNNIFSQTKL